MPSYQPPRGRVLVAIVVSLSLHALIGLGWLAAREQVPAGSAAINTQVDGPDDHETTFVLRDPPSPPRSTPKTEHSDPPSPIVLPPSVLEPARPDAGLGAITQTGHSPEESSSLPKNGGAKPLHGNLKSGTTVVYLLDHSSSMNVGGLLKSAIAAIKSSLAQLGPEVRFQIVVYNGGTCQLASGPLPASPENARQAAEWMDGLLAEGRSDHVAGFRDALWCQPDTIFLLTDADDLDAKETRAIREMLRRPIRLNSAILGPRREKVDTPLERLIRDFGGEVRYVTP
jgi:von Willebrand factor type A domain